MGGCPPAACLDKLRKCRILAKMGVGYDDVPLERLGKMGVAVCNTPDYGTREVADHAIALMLTLAKSIAYHDSELRADLTIACDGRWSLCRRSRHSRLVPSRTVHAPRWHGSCFPSSFSHGRTAAALRATPPHSSSRRSAA